MVSSVNRQEIKILLVEDSPSLAEMYIAYLDRAGIKSHESSNLTDAKAVYDRYAPDLVLIDLDCHDRSGLNFLQHVEQRERSPEVVALTPTRSRNIAVEAMQLGAIDFLAKPFDASRLIVTLNNVIAKIKLERKAIPWNAGEREGLSGLLGHSVAMEAIRNKIEDLGASNASIFVTGESGTAKDLVAEAIHLNSERGDSRFVPVNCGTVPSGLLESELFGHVKGAFRGATADRTGGVATAADGTLFLDEICELDLRMQNKLLRFLQTGTFCQMGGSRIERANVRLICATSREPLNEVRQGRLLEDLFYRIYVVPMRMPSLRERKEDIVSIAKQCLATATNAGSGQFSGFSAESMTALQDYIWPGNERQLENVIHQLVNRNEGRTVECAMLPDYIRSGSVNNPESASFLGAIHTVQDAGPLQGLVRPLWMTERSAIEDAIAVCGGNINKAAALLEVAPATIYRKYQSWRRIEA